MSLKRPPVLPQVVRRKHQPKAFWDDMYHRAVSCSWSRFVLMLGGAYLIINLCFGILFWQFGTLLGGPPSFVDAFFFSVQTLSTIGYGTLSPVGFVSNLLVTCEAFTGILFVAMATGFSFARLSTAHSRLVFSDFGVLDETVSPPRLLF